MVKRRVQTFLDEDLLIRLEKASQLKYGKISVYRIVAEFAVEGLENFERSGKANSETAGSGEQTRERPWRDILQPSDARTEYWRKRRGKR